jgi:nucleotide-binding universal stress UspA family protein
VRPGPGRTKSALLSRVARAGVRKAAGTSTAAASGRQVEEKGSAIMFKHILLPTDGSELSESAVRKAMQFARSIDAKVTGLHVIPKFHVFTYRTDMLEDTRAEFARDSQAQAEKYLAVVSAMAREAGVACDVQSVVSDHPHHAIVQIARERGCDAIVMASHGRSGIQAILLGSQTSKVLVHTNLPVLVLR